MLSAAVDAPKPAAGTAVWSRCVFDARDGSDTADDTDDGAATSFALPITATMLLTGTVSPSCARISESTPAPGDGISASTLSVEISNSGSSRSTLSPTFLIQRTIVPSATDSPICGITTSINTRNPVIEEVGNRDIAFAKSTIYPLTRFTAVLL